MKRVPRSDTLRRLARRLATATGATSDAVRVAALEQSVHALRLQIGSLRARQHRVWPPATLREAEFQVFSQFGEDGILQYLLANVGAVPEVFVEFGVGDYAEANTLFLLLHDNWRGLILDGSADAIASVRGRDWFWRHDLRAEGAFIDRDNIDMLIASHGIAGEIGLLSIDIDGNDYWVWQRIAGVNPVIVVVEYNSLFGPDRAVSVPYDPSFQRTRAHPSNLYWGASLGALCHLARNKGYACVGSNRAGNNAFFVRADRRGDLPALAARDGWVASRFRESRDVEGRLTFLSGDERLRAIADLPLVDVETGVTLRVGDLAGATPPGVR